MYFSKKSHCVLFLFVNGARLIADRLSHGAVSELLWSVLISFSVFLVQPVNTEIMLVYCTGGGKGPGGIIISY